MVSSSRSVEAVITSRARPQGGGVGTGGVGHDPTLAGPAGPQDRSCRWGHLAWKGASTGSVVIEQLSSKALPWAGLTSRRIWKEHPWTG